MAIQRRGFTALGKFTGIFVFSTQVETSLHVLPSHRDHVSSIHKLQLKKKAEEEKKLYVGIGNSQTHNLKKKRLLSNPVRSG